MIEMRASSSLSPWSVVVIERQYRDLQFLYRSSASRTHSILHVIRLGSVYRPARLHIEASFDPQRQGLRSSLSVWTHFYAARAMALGPQPLLSQGPSRGISFAGSCCILYVHTGSPWPVPSISCVSLKVSCPVVVGVSLA